MASRHTHLMQKMVLQAQHLEREYVLPYSYAVIDAGLREHFHQQAQRDPSAQGYKRSRYTDGSSRYTLRTSRREDAHETADIDVRTVGDQQTYISITLRPLVANVAQEDRDYLEGWCRFRLFAFVSWLWVDQSRMAKLKSPTPDNTLVVSGDPLVLMPDADKAPLVDPAVAVVSTTPSEPLTSPTNVPEAPPDEVVERSLQSVMGRPRVDYNEWARQQDAAGVDRDTIFEGYLERIGTFDRDDDKQMKQLRDQFRKALTRTKRTKRT